MTKVVFTLWVRRTQDSLFFSYELLDLTPSYHFDCLLIYPERDKGVLEKGSEDAYRKAKETYDAQVVTYNAKGRISKPECARQNSNVGVGTGMLPSDRIANEGVGDSFTLEEASRPELAKLIMTTPIQWMSLSLGRL